MSLNRARPIRSEDPRSSTACQIVYIDSIRVGFKQKTYARPIAALGLNIAWEWRTRSRPDTRPQPEAWVNLIWALADVVILATYFRCGFSLWCRVTLRPDHRQISATDTGKDDIAKIVSDLPIFRDHLGVLRSVPRDRTCYASL